MCIIIIRKFVEWDNDFPMVQIPYQTNKASLVEKIAELVENKVF